MIPRGLGRSYGDAGQRAGGLVLDMTRLDSIGPVDRDSGLVTVGAGVSIDQLLRVVLPQGGFVPVTPGTRNVTIGGAIAADIHGKNHHRDGSFCRHVTSMTLVTPTGVHEVTPDHDPDLFWATAGGMGLTGIVVRATIRLLPVESSWVTVDTHRFARLEDLMHEMEAHDHDYHYSVAWVDCNAGGSRLGRSILTRGDHAGRERVARSPSRALPPGTGQPPRENSPAAAEGSLERGQCDRLQRVVVPQGTEGATGRAPAHRCVLPPSRRGERLEPAVRTERISPVSVRRRVIMHGEVVREAIDLVCAARVPSFVSVLKRFGPGDDGPLSFPIAGWTLALDFPVGPAALPTLVDALDEVVLNAGGRVYLAKDSRARPEHVHKMYPRIPELQSVRDRIDPDRVLQSDLSRRLDI